MSTAKYYGIFKYSPNDENPKKYDEKCHFWNSLNKNATKLEEEFIAYTKHILDKNSDLYQEIRERYNEMIYCNFIDLRERVFYVADENFNILYECKKPYTRLGDFSDKVTKALKRFGFDVDNYAGKFRTDESMKLLKIHVKVEEQIKKIPQERIDEFIKLFEKEEDNRIE